MTSILDQKIISEKLFYPRYSRIENPHWIERDSAMLACYYYQIDNPKNTIIYFHGNGEVVSDYLGFFDEEMEALGCSILFAEYRGYGMSEGAEPSLVAMLEDAVAIVESIDVPKEEIILFGRSMGSLYALHTASVFPDIAGLIIESGIADMERWMLDKIALEDIGISRETIVGELDKYLDHKSKIKFFRGQTLIMHTKHDRLVDASHALALYSWADNPRQIRIFELGDHNSIMVVNKEEYFSIIGDFIQGIKEDNQWWKFWK